MYRGPTAEIKDTGLKPDLQNLYEIRAAHARAKLSSLQTSLSKSQHVANFDDVTIFCAGSYARLEASEASDIDLFFISSKPRGAYAEYNVPIIRMMADIVGIGDDLGFPKFSNDGQYLQILHSADMLEKLGGSEDDYTNNFTARLLMLLESEPLHREDIFNSIISEIIESYFRDYPGHESSFRPNFLINDIVRFWKTLCLNYENKRNQRDDDAQKIIKQKIKNFKLKYSRLMTCYASIAYMTSLPIPMKHNDVLSMTRLPPNNRLRTVVENVPDARPAINESLELYHWFLERTGSSESELYEYFSDEERRRDAFSRANMFGDKMFEVLRAVDEQNKVFRYLVI